MTLRIGSLFSGYGGLDIAVQSVLGGDLAWYSEIEPAACRVLAAHHPGVPNLGDITAVDWAAVEPVDVLTGGYPCQPFSHAGKRKGTNDERHLWPYVRDAIRVLRPRVTVLENVRGHLTLGFDTVLADLAELGMSARWGVVRAADAGAPHGRARLFIVVSDPANANGQGPQGLSVPAPAIHPAGPRRVAADAGAAVHPEGATGGQRRREPGSGQAQSGPEGATGGQRRREPGSGQAQSGGPDQRAAADASRGSLARAAATGDGLSVAAERGDLTAADPDRHGHGRELHARGVGSLEGETEGGPRERQRARRELDAGGDLAAADTAGAERGGAQRASVDTATRPAAEPGERGGTDWGKYAPAIHRWEHVLGRPAPSPTVPGRNGRPRLNPVLVEWMMGLPEGHVTGHGLSAAQELKMLGNGVVPQQAALALRMLLGGQVAA